MHQFCLAVPGMLANDKSSGFGSSCGEVFLSGSSEPDMLPCFLLLFQPRLAHSLVEAQPELIGDLQTFMYEFVFPSFPQPLPLVLPVVSFLARFSTQFLTVSLASSNCSQDEEARLPGLLRMLIWAQKQLDHQNVVYPRINDILTGELSSSGTQ